MNALLLAAPGGPAANPSLLPGLLMAGGVLLAVIITLRHWMRKRRMPSELDRDPRERIDEIHDRSMSRDRIETQMAEAEELARRLGATLDNKAARLELLLEEAERVLGRIEGRPTDQSAPRGHDDVYKLADEGRHPDEIAAALDRPVGQVELILNLRRSG